jgi:hypothetical protein
VEDGGHGRAWACVVVGSIWKISVSSSEIFLLTYNCSKDKIYFLIENFEVEVRNRIILRNEQKV